MTDWGSISAESARRHVQAAYDQAVAAGGFPLETDVARRERAERSRDAAMPTQYQTNLMNSWAANMSALEEGRVRPSKPVAARSDASPDPSWEKLDEAPGVVVNFGLVLRSEAQGRDVPVCPEDFVGNRYSSGWPQVVGQHPFLTWHEVGALAAPVLAARLAELESLRATLMPRALEVARAKKRQLDAARARAETPDAVARRAKEARGRAVVSLSKVLARPEFAGMEAARVADVLRRAQADAAAYESMTSWVRTAPLAAKHVTEEDVAEAIGLARVQEVLGS